MQFWMLENEQGEFAKDQDGFPVVFTTSEKAQTDRDTYEKIIGQRWKVVRKPPRFHKVECRLIGF